ncbi:uncharacterized protein LOC132725832 [Ruditapes philippinarum]|uniref:uncharacterized protein LOC132725832 n=1 Tax=Ruditapes philippinarum TaxID=129788 RepID=UPI00295A9314|nr:uncharacterized protein LOC132725832 [Ruditapes philippinarum]
MKYLLPLLFGLALISSVYNEIGGVSSFKCRQCEWCPEYEDEHYLSSYMYMYVSCEGSCVKSIKDNKITKGCSNISLISKCERQGDLTVCACDSDKCNRSSETRMTLYGLFTSCIIFLLVAVIN